MIRHLTGLILETDQELEDILSTYGYTKVGDKLYSNDINVLEIYRDERGLIHIEEEK